MTSLKNNLANVQEKIARACERAGRERGEVTLVAVSKTKPLDDIEELMETGQLDYGENYVQELCEKYEHISRPVRWHMIGHLQRNKVKYVVDKAVLIHSVDSVKLAAQIEKEAAKRDRTADILIQVNIAGEETKYGLSQENTLQMVREIGEFPHVHIRGLMTSAPPVADPEKNRCYFRKLRELFIDIREKNIDNVDMEILSMGMTNDYETAIEEGATMIRVGAGIFGERKYNKQEVHEHG